MIVYNSHEDSLLQFMCYLSLYLFCYLLRLLRNNVRFYLLFLCRQLDHTPHCGVLLYSKAGLLVMCVVKTDIVILRFS